jgi:hypothetical protein
MEAKWQTLRLHIELITLEQADVSRVIGFRTSTGLALMNAKRDGRAD